MSRRKRTRNLNSLRKLSRQIEAILTDNKKAHYVEQHIEEIPETIFPKALQKILPSQNLNITLDNYTISLTNVTFKFDDNFNKIRFTGEEFI